MIFKKKLPKEYKNTCLIEFTGAPNAKRVLVKLRDLNMISDKDIKRLWNMNNLSTEDPYYNALKSKMDKIAPEGFSFDVKHDYMTTDRSPTEKIISIGFY